MTTLAKVLLTISGILGILFIWAEIKKEKFKDLLVSIKSATEDGSISADEALTLIGKIIELFKK
jgi:hypothetical protein